MFYNINRIRSSHEKNLLKFLPIKQLYIMYYILCKPNNRLKNLSLIYFYINVYTYFERFKVISNKVVFVMLSVFFTIKTYNILSLSDCTQTKGVFSYKNNIITMHDYNSSIIYHRYSTFWKKWKKLKRPTTTDNFDEFFVNIWKVKIAKYVGLGFIKTYDNYRILRYKTELFCKNPVFFTKSLLISPKYSSSSINKHISVQDSKNFEFQFLRKNKVYNKGRYSRCRQNYRTGVYMCMYLSIVSIFGLYYWFYKFSFNFTYLWWLFIVFIGSFFLPKIFKYRLYEPTTLISKSFDFFRWFSLIIRSFF